MNTNGRVHLTSEHCAARYPRLTKCLQFVLCGSVGEAAGCIRDYRDGYLIGGEAVSHSGLTTQDRMGDAASQPTRRAVRIIYARRTGRIIDAI